MGKIGYSFLFLLVSLISFLLPFGQSLICNPNIPNGCPSEILGITPQSNNTYINQTINQYNTTFNSTQFDTTNPAHINESWLTTFIQSIANSLSKWDNYLSLSGGTMTGNINMNGNNITNITKTTYKNSSYGIWSNETDIVIGYIAGL